MHARMLQDEHSGALAAGRTARVLRATAASPPYSRVLAASMYQSANWIRN